MSDQGEGTAEFTRPQYVRWANRREKAQGALYDALSYLRQMSMVTDGLVEATARTATGDQAKVADAHHYAKDAVGCIEGALSLLGNALAAMPEGVKPKKARP